MTWDELKAWKPLHYGPVWCRHQDAYPRLMAEADKAEAEGKPEAEQLGSRSRRHEDAMTTVQVEIDAELLAEGKTWREILSFPPLGLAEGDGPVYRSPSPSSDGSGFRTFPPTPTKFDQQARVGPMPEGYIRDEDWGNGTGTGQRTSGTGNGTVNSGLEFTIRASRVGWKITVRLKSDTKPTSNAWDARSDRIAKTRQAPCYARRSWNSSTGFGLCLLTTMMNRRSSCVGKDILTANGKVGHRSRLTPRIRPIRSRCSVGVQEQEEERKRPPKDKEEMNLKFFQWNYQWFTREEQE